MCYARGEPMPNLKSIIAILATFSGFTGLAFSQVSPPLNCQTNVTVTPQMRGEGYTELTGNITLACSGGTTLSAGSTIPLVDITVFYNTTVTSRILPSSAAPGSQVSEALLLIDEPGSGIGGYGSTLPQVLCGTPLTGCPATVGSVAGPTYGTAVSSGSVPAPNVYQGVVSFNTVTFYGIPVLPPGGGTRLYRIANVRLNAVPLAGSFGSYPLPAQSSLSISGAASLSISQSSLPVGFVYNGLSSSVTNSANFNQCSNQTLASAATLTYAENFGNAFKTRVVPQTNTAYAGQTNNPGFTDLTPGSLVFPNQNTPGGI
jgi:hypothetical protein